MGGARVFRFSMRAHRDCVSDGPPAAQDFRRAYWRQQIIFDIILRLCPAL